MAEEGSGLMRRLFAWIGSWNTKAKVITATLTVVVAVVFYKEILEIVWTIAIYGATLGLFVYSFKELADSTRAQWDRDGRGVWLCKHCGSEGRRGHNVCPSCGREQ